MRWFGTHAGVSAILLASVGMFGCSDSPTAPSSVPPFTITEIRVGTGTEAVDGSIVTVDYVGWLFDEDAEGGRGAEFGRGNGYVFRLGSGQVIPGWDHGIVGMRVGGVRRLLVPHNLAFGEVGAQGVPPWATVVFEVQLVDVQ